MDLVIPLLPASANNHTELRYALRSFEKFLPHDRLILIGGHPNWLVFDNVVNIPFRDDPQPPFREANIYLKIKYYVEKISKGDPFIFANDDYFLLAPWKADEPYPNKGSLSDAVKSRGELDPYRKTIKNTARLIGYDAPNLDVHAPMTVYPEIFSRVFGHSNAGKQAATQHPIQWGTPFGFLFKSLYGQNFETLKSIDLKFNKPEEFNSWIAREPDSELSTAPFFSTNDPAITERTIDEVFEVLYPNMSRYE